MNQLLVKHEFNFWAHFVKCEIGEKENEWKSYSSSKTKPQKTLKQMVDKGKTLIGLSFLFKF